jgi:hypothetical protein
MAIESIEDIGNLLRESVEVIGTQFTEPDDDWIPVMGLVPQDGTNVMLAFQGEWLSSEKNKDALVENVMVPAITGVGAKTLGTVFSAWMAEAPADTPIEDLPKPSESPNKKEIVIVTAMDSFSVKTWTVEILRSKDSPPKLSSWEEIKGTTAFSGRFVDEIQEALRDSSGQTDPEFMELLAKEGIEIDE